MPAGNTPLITQRAERVTAEAITGITFARGFNVRALIMKRNTEGVPIPKIQGTDACIAYFKRGECNSDCGRKGSHRKPNAAEMQLLRNYIGEE
jgi:hypothetical protein